MPLAAIALRLLAMRDTQDLIYLAADERRAEEIGHILARLAPEVETLVLPPWDCLPFDRASPSRESMGRRMSVLRRLATRGDAPVIVVTTIEAVSQKLPPSTSACETLTIETGATLDDGTLKAFAVRVGYVASERVDEPGQFEHHGRVVEVFPPDAQQPFRIDLDQGRVTAIAAFDPVSQRSGREIPRLVIPPTSELVFDIAAIETERVGGCEHHLPRHYGEPLRSLFDVLPEAILFAAPETEARRTAFEEQLAEAHATHRAWHGRATTVGDGDLPGWRDLYLDTAGWQAVLDRHEEQDLPDRNLTAPPDFAGEPKPAHAFAEYVRQQSTAGITVVLAGMARDLKALAGFLDRHDAAKPVAALNWRTVTEAAPGSFLSLDLDLDEGVVDTAQAIALVAAADILGTRAHRAEQRHGVHAALMPTPALRIGDTVIHEDHGIGVLRSLEAVEIDGAQRDAIRLEYHDGESLLVPVDGLDRVWRYGADDAVVALDRLHTDAWTKRRIEVVKGLIATARHLVTVATERQNRTAPKLVAPRRAYETVAARFPYPETPDQARAIAAVIDDLARGRPMDRLVCGDVGYGKTEVAVRAATVALLSGKQVALVAPTTVLARQHLQTFRRRFEGLGIEIAGLSRLESGTEARRVKAGLADGSIAMVIGTQAVTGACFADLGLLVIDEEQKFGARLKGELRAKAERGHVLTMTATPIPRTLEMAMVGLQDVSVIATPPVRRRPIRTFVAPFDSAAVRMALMREHARGGQSFVIVPRIAEIETMRKRLGEIVPDLSIAVAHGELAAEDADRAMTGFANGEGDILLATNIVESGLDVPRANTMLVWHADQFGLAQLHQLRGRVGRGRAQGVAYLLTNPNTPLPAATERRLATMQAFDRLGSGFAISARDLDLRGAGDLVGDEQAGHMRLIGLGLYQSLLARAVREAKGEVLDDDTPPDVRLDLVGAIPEDYVAEPDLRIDLYSRLARLDSASAIAGFADEVEDRFGTPPSSTVALLALARLRVLCRAHGVAAVSAGPRGVALTMRPAGLAAAKTCAAADAALDLKGSKLVWHVAVPDGRGAALAEDLLDRLAGIPARRAATA